jgi:hypothetical protein
MRGFYQPAVVAAPLEDSTWVLQQDIFYGMAVAIPSAANGFSVNFNEYARFTRIHEFLAYATLEGVCGCSCPELFHGLVPIRD